MRIWADFHEVDQDNQIWADLKQAEFVVFDEAGELVGQEVGLFDGSGLQCRGVVQETQGNWLLVQIDPLTWKDLFPDFSLPVSPRIEEARSLTEHVA
jgi:hypothetical protein